MTHSLAWLAELAYVMLPAFAANMAPPFTRFWHGWNPLISRRWLGDHKTVVAREPGEVVGSQTICPASPEQAIQVG